MSDDEYDELPSTPQENVRVYRMPVTLYEDKETGEQFFYLQKSTFPGRSITDLKIRYNDSEKSQVREQVLADSSCPEIVLKDVPVECCFAVSESPTEDDPNAFLTDDSFRLSGSKIGAIRMRMYAKNKMEAQKQLEDPSCTIIRLALDIECRLVAR